jgi:hypothetical protein
VAQHDYNIANAAGAAVRADINAALAAILTRNSGATAPTVTAPFMPWFDTAAGVFRIRNQADTAWVLWPVALGIETGDTGTLSVPAGTTAERDTSLGVGIRRNTTLGQWEGWDGSAWGALAGISLLRSYLAGLTLSTAGASATMTVAAGQAADSTNSALMTLASAIGKTTGAWAVGTGNGGLDTGTIANNTWYHFHLIRRPDTGVVDVLLSLSATSPTLPTNYTQFRRIGAGRTNGSAQWIQFLQRGDEFIWFSPILDVDITNEPTTGTLRTMSVPTGVKVQALMNARQDPTGASTDVYFSDPDTTDLAPSQTAAPLSSFSARAGVGTPIPTAQIRCTTNTSAQIRTRHSNGSASNSFRVATYGWIDTRGRDA